MCACRSHDEISESNSKLIYRIIAIAGCGRPQNYYTPSLQSSADDILIIHIPKRPSERAQAPGALPASKSKKSIRLQSSTAHSSYHCGADGQQVTCNRKPVNAVRMKLGVIDTENLKTRVCLRMRAG